MAKRLLIVESPTKAKTLKRYVGKDYSVKASVGHIKDLPKSRLGVDVDNGFAMELEVIRGKKQIIGELRTAAKKVEQVLLAPDPDREGEAIAWHIADELRPVNPRVYRVTFNEITRQAVQEAIKKPRELNRNLYDAQQARRVLDRLVGYKISPLLWDKVKRGLSAGRVQSVAVRLIVEREQAIQAFKAEEFWTVEESLKVIETDGNPFKASLSKIDGQKPEIKTSEQAEQIKTELSGYEHLVTSVEKKARSRRPNSPFTTSTLQQAAAATMRFSAKKTMLIAQQLYEGVEIEGEGSVGLISYMRTDSTRVSPEFVQSTREYIKKEYGPNFLPEQAQVYPSKKGAQDAHEAVRPTVIEFTPAKVKESLTADQYKLYDLIWRRFVACQMNPAQYDQTSVQIQAGPKFELRATGSILIFPGWLLVSRDKKEDDEDISIPPLVGKEKLKVEDIQTIQHFTQPPPRFNEGTLVKELEELGIGRPSTYASILDTIQSKAYVQKVQGRLHPTELGHLVTELLVKSFPEILNVDFTAGMEKQLDGVEEGTVEFVALLKDFYKTFSETMEKAKIEMRDVKREEVPTEHTCDLCGKGMVIKWGRNGYFLACSGYPECKNTREIKTLQGKKVELAPVEQTDQVCEKCGKPMIIRRGRFGRFLACSGYPACKNTKAVSIGIKCPKCGEGQIVERRTRKGRMFYSCSRYPNCDFSVWNEPVAEKCPQCGFGVLVHKVSKKEGHLLACPIKECGYKRTVESPANPEALEE